jgi:hypothetical protein
MHGIAWQDYLALSYLTLALSQCGVEILAQWMFPESYGALVQV